jgi:hypothetical protein
MVQEFGAAAPCEIALGVVPVSTTAGVDSVMVLSSVKLALGTVKLKVCEAVARAFVAWQENCKLVAVGVPTEVQVVVPNLAVAPEVGKLLPVRVNNWVVA